MIDFKTAKNTRSKDIDRYIDFDVKFGDEWVGYTATPTDPVSKEIYKELKTAKVIIAPGEDYDWNGNKWIARTPEQVKAISLIGNGETIRELSNRIDSLKDKIEFGTATEQDKQKLLELRKERSELV